jgi:hypothetical protein
LAGIELPTLLIDALVSLAPLSPDRSGSKRREYLASQQIHESQLVVDELTENQVPCAALHHLMQLFDESLRGPGDRA